ncbi:MAG: hypothetical protein A3H35_05905 [Betaproteobacteria bacterium RIFCSPLOWO2_02_FULL_62_17]|nr:MAG: hypothetical protein A3H35_05905 [Betaproteobacteria bacterium RIFCSPLOWO2_02_FULL_62_17]
MQIMYLLLISLYMLHCTNELYANARVCRATLVPARMGDASSCSRVQDEIFVKMLKSGAT